MPPARRATALLAADMESTIIEQEMIDELASLCGRREEMAALTDATMRGELAFEPSLRHRVRLLAGLTVGDLATAAERITLMPGARTLIATATAHGVRTALVTGGFSFFAERVADALGFDTWHANTLEIEDGRLTGHLKDPVLGPGAKRQILFDLAAKYGIDPGDTVAIGDGANDLEMLRAAGLGIAFMPKPAVADWALTAPTGIVLDRPDLSTVLELLGLHPEPCN